jgi:hypothetical protein
VGGGGLGFGVRHCRAKGPSGILIFCKGETALHIPINYACIHKKYRMSEIQCFACSKRAKISKDYANGVCERNGCSAARTAGWAE